MGNVFKKIVGAVTNIFSLKTDNTIAIGYDGSNNMTFKDGVVSGTKTLAQLLAVTAHASTHNAGGSDAMAIDAAAATGSLRTIGTTATAACAGNDSRLSDPRTPTAHASSHQSGGSDAIKIDDLAAGDDNTDLNASTTKHGLLKKLSNIATEFLNGAGNWATPTVSGFLNEFFGDASDGNVTISTNTTLTKDMHYDTLTINSGIVLNANGFRVFARTLTYGGNNSAISCDGAAGVAYKTNESNYGGAGGGGTSTSPSFIPGGEGGYAACDEAYSDFAGYIGGFAYRCAGTGTAGDGGAGGDSIDGDDWGGGAKGESYTHCDYRFPWRNLSQCVDLIYRTQSGGVYVDTPVGGGAGGGGGGGYDSFTDYSGGSGGGGGGVCWVAAKTVNGPASGTAYIRANGGIGGAGRTTVGTGTGGGGGGGGGFALLFYNTQGTNFANVTLQAALGSGGAGRNAGSAGIAGTTYTKQVTIS